MAFFELILFAVISVSVGLYIYFSRCYSYFEKKNVPFEKPKFFFGSFLDVLLGDLPFGKYLAKLYQKYNCPYFGIFIMNKPVLVVKDPNLVKQIFVKDFQNFTDKNFFTDVKIDTLFSKSIITASQNKWKFLRSQLTRVFSSGKLKLMVEMEKDIAEKLVTYLTSRLDKDFDLTRLIGNFATDAISACFFGINSNCFKEENMVNFHGTHIFPRSGFGAIILYSYNFMHKAVKLFRFRFFSLESSNFLTKYFSDVLKNRKMENVKRYDFIDLLLNLKDNEDFTSDEDALISQAVSFLSAGQDTTNVTTSFTLHELCKNVEIQDRLRAEIKEVVEKHGVSYESINEMKYLDMVISETLRKYPVVNFLQRRAREDYELPGTGLKIESGSYVLVPLHGLHFDPEFYPNPDKFDPERFNDENKHKLNSYIYVPFGIGPRNCIGRRFAVLTVKIALVYMLKNFKFEEYNNPDKLVFKTSYVGRSSNDFKFVCHVAN